ncbi:hypothetical protein EYF80_056710 [Liparis tanakae]|uniref:Uncharacterized protein n=1 Tax=Liparis tanakae TaxID=230148 RepID=A0A4Z2EWD6_9TELE|nr:hypothetical protein EYF80_056710 [Liparis tanakae]
MAGEGVVLDPDGEVQHQGLLPEGSERAQQLQAVGLGGPQHSPALWGPIALWGAARFTTAGVAAVVRSTDATGFIHSPRIIEYQKSKSIPAEYSEAAEEEGAQGDEEKVEGKESMSPLQLSHSSNADIKLHNNNSANTDKSDRTDTDENRAAAAESESAPNPRQAHGSVTYMHTGGIFFYFIDPKWAADTLN